MVNALAGEATDWPARRAGNRVMTTARRSLPCVVFCLLSAVPLAAAERWSIGLTAGNQRIVARVVEGASASAPTVLLIGGLAGSDATADVVSREVAAFEALPQSRRSFRLIALPLANPDGRPLQFPPAGTAYKENAESHVLWRWIGIHAPDLAIVVGESAGGLADALSQLRLGNTAEVLRLADRYLDGSADSFARPSQSSLAAHMLFYEIARRTGD